MKLSKTAKKAANIIASPIKRTSTVAEVIEHLKTLPPDLPVYTRPKYTGEADWTHDYPISINGISEMDKGEVGEYHVCILF